MRRTQKLHATSLQIELHKFFLKPKQCRRNVLQRARNGDWFLIQTPR
jgi:hypothetical protein